MKQLIIDTMNNQSTEDFFTNPSAAWTVAL